MVMSKEEIRKRRINLGMTQYTLAKALGVSQGIISKFESGKNYPGYSSLKKIEEGLAELESKSSRKVFEIMSKKVYFVSSHDKVKDVAHIFREKGYSQAPVIDGGVVGMITARGLLEAEPSDTVEQYMEPEPPIISKDAPVISAKSLLKHCEMILVSEKGKIVGVVTREDVI